MTQELIFNGFWYQCNNRNQSIRKKQLPDIIMASSTSSLESMVLPKLGSVTPSVTPLLISSRLAGFFGLKNEMLIKKIHYQVISV